MEEKVKICFHWVCFNPRNLPTPALKTPTIIFIGKLKNGINVIINKGPIFCQTNKIKISLDCKVETKVGNQKWNGASPSFTIKATKSNLTLNLGKYEKNDAKIITEAILWTKKYFIAEKEDWVFLRIIGKKEKVLSSSPIHITIKLEEEITNIGLSNKVE